MQTVIERCEALALPAPTTTYTEGDLNDAIHRARNEFDEMYAFEGVAKKALSRHIAALQRQKTALSYQVQYRKFANLDMMRWRNPDGMPTVALFGLDNPTCCISVSAGNTMARLERPYTENNSALDACYQDFWETYRRHVKSGGFWKPYAIRFRCTYGGVIPRSARKTIEAARQAFGHSNVLLMAEGLNWTREDEPQPVIADPLIVGWDGQDLWLIDRFDLTSIERLIATEFTI